jgi:hypothetical protein
MKVPRLLNITAEVIGQCIKTGAQGKIIEEHQKVLQTCRKNIVFYIAHTVHNLNN